MSKPAPIRLTMPSSRQRRDDARGDRRVLQQDAGAAARRVDHVVLGRALRDLRARGRRSRRSRARGRCRGNRDRRTGSWASAEACERRGARRDGERYAASGRGQAAVPRRRGDAETSQRSESTECARSSLGDPPMTDTVAQRRSPAACPSRRGSPSPKQLWAPWKLEGDGARRRQARRGAPRRARPGAGGHRHRHRRRADAPPFRHDVHRGPRRRRLRAQARRCASATATTPTCRSSSGRSRAGTRSSSTTRRSCARRRRSRSSSRCPAR